MAELNPEQIHEEKLEVLQNNLIKNLQKQGSFSEQQVLPFENTKGIFLQQMVDETTTILDAYILDYALDGVRGIGELITSKIPRWEKRRVQSKGMIEYLKYFGKIEAIPNRITLIAYYEQLATLSSDRMSELRELQSHF